MHDHATRGKRFCPTMKEWCIKGWTPSMGKNEDGFPLEGACAAWQPVTTFNIKEGKNEEVYDCAAFGWPADLMSEVAKEVYQGAASTDKVANEVQKHRQVFVRALSQDVPERIIPIETQKPEQLSQGIAGGTNGVTE